MMGESLIFTHSSFSDTLNAVFLEDQNSCWSQLDFRSWRIEYKCNDKRHNLLSNLDKMHVIQSRLVFDKRQLVIKFWMINCSGNLERRDISVFPLKSWPISFQNWINSHNALPCEMRVLSLNLQSAPSDGKTGNAVMKQNVCKWIFQIANKVRQVNNLTRLYSF